MKLKEEEKIILLAVIAMILTAIFVIVGVITIFLGSSLYIIETGKKVFEIIPPAYVPDNPENSSFPGTPSITYACNVTQGTITIFTVDGNTSELVWSNVVFSDVNWEFQATLPTGTIDAGDIITNCSGKVALT